MKHLRQKFLPLTIATAIIASPFCGAQVLQSIDFSTQSPGAGLNAMGNSFSGYYYGTASISGGLQTDPLVGVLAGSSSPLGSGNAGYIGGAGTQVSLSAGSGDFGLSIFPGDPNTPATQQMNSATSTISLNVDFAVQRTSGNANGQYFDFSIFDALGPVQSNNFAYHSTVSIAPNNQVFTQANQNAPFVSTGVTLTNNAAYHLQTTVNYNSATWSASLTQGNQTFNLVTGAPIDVSSFTLSGYTTPAAGWANAEMYATQASASNAAFADRLVFDNYTVTAVPEPSTYAAVLGVTVLGFTVIRRKRAMAVT